MKQAIITPKHNTPGRACERVWRCGSLASAGLQSYFQIGERSGLAISSVRFPTGRNLTKSLGRRAVQGVCASDYDCFTVHWGNINYCMGGSSFARVDAKLRLW